MIEKIGEKEQKEELTFEEKKNLMRDTRERIKEMSPEEIDKLSTEAHGLKGLIEWWAAEGRTVIPEGFNKLKFVERVLNREVGKLIRSGEIEWGENEKKDIERLDEYDGAPLTLAHEIEKGDTSLLDRHEKFLGQFEKKG